MYPYTQLERDPADKTLGVRTSTTQILRKLSLTNITVDHQPVKTQVAWAYSFGSICVLVDWSLGPHSARQVSSHQAPTLDSVLETSVHDYPGSTAMDCVVHYGRRVWQRSDPEVKERKRKGAGSRYPLQ